MDKEVEEEEEEEVAEVGGVSAMCRCGCRTVQGHGGAAGVEVGGGGGRTEEKHYVLIEQGWLPSKLISSKSAGQSTAASTLTAPSQHGLHCHANTSVHDFLMQSSHSHLSCVLTADTGLNGGFPTLPPPHPSLHSPACAEETSLHSP